MLLIHIYIERERDLSWKDIHILANKSYKYGNKKNKYV
jgi:hypothetical protein